MSYGQDRHALLNFLIVDDIYKKPNYLNDGL